MSFYSPNLNWFLKCTMNIQFHLFSAWKKIFHFQSKTHSLYYVWLKSEIQGFYQIREKKCNRMPKEVLGADLTYNWGWYFRHTLYTLKTFTDDHRDQICNVAFVTSMNNRVILLERCNFVLLKKHSLEVTFFQKSENKWTWTKRKENYEFKILQVHE